MLLKNIVKNIVVATEALMGGRWVPTYIGKNTTTLLKSFLFEQQKLWGFQFKKKPTFYFLLTPKTKSYNLRLQVSTGCEEGVMNQRIPSNLMIAIYKCPISQYKLVQKL